MPATLTPLSPGIVESSLDVLLDVASGSGARLTWGRSRLTRRHWVAMAFPDGSARARRARTRTEAARRLLHDVYREPRRCHPRS